MDVVIVSCGKNAELKKMTQNTVNSCINSSGEFNVVVVETCQSVTYENCTTLFYKPAGRFNYNRALNYGIRNCHDEYIACCNNDLLFSPSWWKNMKVVFEHHGFDSLSPFEPNWHETWEECNILGQKPRSGDYVYPGGTVRVHFAGWCYVIKREAFNKIGGFSELVEFYYSDNIVVEQYKKFGLKHALCGNSIVKHLGEKTWRNVLCSSQQRYYTSGQQNKFTNAKRILWST